MMMNHIEQTRWIRQAARPLMLVFLLLGGFPGRADALPRPDGDHSATEEFANRRLYVGMWTLHFRELERGLDNNWALGVAWSGIYGATFINSFGNRA
jgi:hypothetical protein